MLLYGWFLEKWAHVCVGLMYITYLNVFNILLDFNLLNVGQLHVYCGKKLGNGMMYYI